MVWPPPGPCRLICKTYCKSHHHCRTLKDDRGQLVTSVGNKVASSVLRRRHTLCPWVTASGLRVEAWTDDLENSRLVRGLWGGCAGARRVGGQVTTLPSLGFHVCDRKLDEDHLQGSPERPNPAAQVLDCDQPDGPDPFPVARQRPLSPEDHSGVGAPRGTCRDALCSSLGLGGARGARLSWLRPV